MKKMTDVNTESNLKLHSYNGRMLTVPEILLLKFYKLRATEQNREADEKRSEKELLLRISLNMGIQMVCSQV